MIFSNNICYSSALPLFQARLLYRAKLHLSSVKVKWKRDNSSNTLLFRFVVLCFCFFCFSGLSTNWYNLILIFLLNWRTGGANSPANGRVTRGNGRGRGIEATTRSSRSANMKALQSTAKSDVMQGKNWSGFSNNSIYQRGCMHTRLSNGGFSKVAHRDAEVWCPCRCFLLFRHVASTIHCTACGCSDCPCWGHSTGSIVAAIGLISRKQLQPVSSPGSCQCLDGAKQNEIFLKKAGNSRLTLLYYQAGRVRAKWD